MAERGHKERVTVYVVSHTHWDREWYSTFQQFRMRLVALIDKLLDILERDENFRHFVLDGQTVVVEDYLEIRPENRERLERLVREGRISIGPWYVLPDEFLISGEAHVRNALLGHLIGEQFGGVMKAGYMPDPFGHISQMPQILRGFDIETFIFTRGLGDEWDGRSTEFWWEAPDGSKVLAIFQRYGYCNLANVGYVREEEGFRLDMERAMEHIGKQLESLIPLASSGIVLLNNGCDHLEPQPELPAILKEAERRFPEVEFVHASFEDFSKALLKAIKGKRLQTIRGEIRWGKYHPILVGVLSTRVYLKQLNERTLTLLERYSEPLCAFSWLAGADYPSAFLWKAWRLVLQCHPHDSICGCSIDQVHREMIPRFEQAQQIGEELANRSVAHLARLTNTLVGPEREGAQSLLVYNPLYFPATGPVEVELKIPLPEGKKPSRLTVFDPDGRPVPAQISHEEIAEYEQGIPPDMRTWKVKVHFLASDLPPCGYRVYSVAPAEPEDKFEPTDICAGPNWMENKFLKVQVNPDGTCDVTHKASGVTYCGLNVLEDIEDAGDEYNYSPAPISTVVTSKGTKGHVKLAYCGPVQAAIDVEFTLSVPKELRPDRLTRSEEMIELPVKVRYILSAVSPRLDVELTVDNRAKDHRLRALFPTSIQTDKSVADGQFDVLERPIIPPLGEGWREKPSPAMPQWSFSAVEGNGVGLSVLVRGLHEYEAIPSAEGVTLAVTLLRSVGWLSRDDAISRPYHAGPKIPTPDAQCLGVHTFRYAILPYSGTWRDALIFREAHLFTAPPKAFPVRRRRKQKALPSELSFLSVEPQTVVITAIKKAEREEALVVRLLSLSDKEERARVEFFAPVEEAWVANLNEERKERARKRGKVVTVPIRPKQILTLLVRLATGVSN